MGSSLGSTTSDYSGPFRDVAESSPSFGDRRSYQMNPANRNEAILESVEDEKEGADIIITYHAKEAAILLQK